MNTTIVIVILLLGVILFMQARKRGRTKQAATLRKVALAVMLVALGIAILGVFDTARDHDANEPAPRGIDVDDLGNA